jgi:hypothetical protein
VRIFAEHDPDGEALGVAPAVVAPEEFVDAIVEAAVADLRRS